MSGEEVRVRVATPEDALAVLAVYAPYVEGTAITFEYSVPSEDQFRGRMERILERYPYLVVEHVAPGAGAVLGGDLDPSGMSADPGSIDLRAAGESPASTPRIAGFAYAGPFVGRAAYDWSVETTIYISSDERGRGLGGRLYAALEAALMAQGILNLNACIAYAGVEDEYLTHASVNFHSHLGYRMVGRFHSCGYKFGRWYDMVWMEKMLADHPATPAPVKPFSDLDGATLDSCGIIKLS